MAELYYRALAHHRVELVLRISKNLGVNSRNGTLTKTHENTICLLGLNSLYKSYIQTINCSYKYLVSSYLSIKIQSKSRLVLGFMVSSLSKKNQYCSLLIAITYCQYKGPFSTLVFRIKLLTKTLLIFKENLLFAPIAKSTTLDSMLNLHLSITTYVN